MSSDASVHDIEWYSEVPRSIAKPAMFGFALLVVAFGGFGTWAATAPLAAAVIAAGSFVATGENKIIQHFEGGIIQEILVGEGDHVSAGDPLLRLDGTAASVRQRQLFLRQARLEAMIARLEAVIAGSDEVIFPAIVADHRQDAEIQSIIDSQLTAFASAQSRLKNEIGLLAQNIEALNFRASGFAHQRDSMKKQLGFLAEEYEAKMSLLDKGLIRKTEIKAIQRAMADAEGQIGRLEAEISETETQIRKHDRQIEQTVSELKEGALDETESAQAELDTVREQSREAADVLDRSVVEAPVSGVVVRMHYHTAGGVIESGKKILEILPLEVPLIIETQVQSKDIDAVKTGQRATIRLVALNQRTTPVLDGEVFYVSADSLANSAIEQKKDVYLVRLRISPVELARIKGFAPTPGMPVEVMIQTAERTFVDYLTKPIRDSMSRAFMER
jgi:HlyD family type I secretion membrane fusion protein